MAEKEAPYKRDMIHIPARIGSTRVHQKNIRELNGIPLIAYTIVIAKSIKGIERVVVNTDDPVIGEIAIHYGAEVPFYRPKESAGKNSSLVEAEWFLAEKLQCGARYINMLPTSLFRNVDKYQEYYDRLSDYWYVASARPVAMDFSSILGESPNGLVELGPCGETLDIPRHCIKTTGHFWGPALINAPIRESCIALITDPIELIDIDTEEDLELADHIVSNGLFDFGVEIC